MSNIGGDMLEIAIWSTGLAFAILCLLAALNAVAKRNTVRMANQVTGGIMYFIDFTLATLIAYPMGLRSSDRTIRMTFLVLGLLGLAAMAATLQSEWRWVFVAGGMAVCLSTIRVWFLDEAEREAGIVGLDLTYSKGSELTWEVAFSSVMQIVFLAISIAIIQDAPPSAESQNWWSPPPTILAVGKEIFNALPLVGLWPKTPDDLIAANTPDWLSFIVRGFIQMLFLAAVFHLISIRRKVLVGDDLREDHEILEAGDFDAAKEVVIRAGDRANRLKHERSLALLVAVATANDAIKISLATPDQYLKLRCAALRRLAAYALTYEDFGTMNTVEKHYERIESDLAKNPVLKALHRQHLLEYADYLLRRRPLLSNPTQQLPFVTKEATYLAKLVESLDTTKGVRATNAKARLALVLSWLARRAQPEPDKKAKIQRMKALQQELQAWANLPPSLKESALATDTRALVGRALNELQRWK